MSKPKTTLSFLENKDWKRVKLEIEKVNKLLKYIRTDSKTELNELIYAEAKLVNNKIGNPKGIGIGILNLDGEWG